MYAVRIKCALGQQPDMELMLYENDTVGDMLRQVPTQEHPTAAPSCPSWPCILS